jgi:tetratricopeptide (TPR) repeat protein
LHSFIKTGLLPVVCLALLMTGCASTGQFNQGRGAWNSPEYFHQPPRVKRKYQAALDVMRSGDMAAAAIVFEEFNSKYSGYPGAYVNLAIVYDGLDRPDEAYAMLDIATEIIPGYVIALNQEGLMKRRRGDFSGARDAWLAATESDPEFANAWYNLGVLNDIYLQDLPSALDAYQRYQDIYVSAQLAPGGEYAADLVAEPDKQVHGWMADVQRRIGHTQRAAKTIEEAP